MSQSISSFNSDGYQIMLLPLKIMSEGVVNVRIDRVYVRNFNEEGYLSPLDYAFKIKEQYCDYSNTSNAIINMNYYSFINSLPESFSSNDKIDFLVQKQFNLTSEDEFFEFKISFEPISEVIRYGNFTCDVVIDYTNVDSGGASQVSFQVNGGCSLKAIKNIDGIEVNSNDYELSINSKAYNQFIIIN